MRKPAFRILENKDSDQLCGKCTADQRDQHLCFCYIDSKIPLPSKSKFQASSHLPWGVQPGLILTYLETQKTGFRAMWLK